MDTTLLILRKNVYSQTHTDSEKDSYGNSHVVKQNAMMSRLTKVWKYNGLRQPNPSKSTAFTWKANASGSFLMYVSSVASQDGCYLFVDELWKHVYWK